MSETELVMNGVVSSAEGPGASIVCLLDYYLTFPR